MDQVIWMEDGKAKAGTHEEICFGKDAGVPVCMRHRAMKERMRKWKRKIEKQFLNIQRKGGVADETEKDMVRKCDPGHREKAENGCLPGIAVAAVIGAVVAALIPPLILAKIIDTVTAGNEALPFSVILLYFVLLALTGISGSLRGKDS